MLGEKISGKNKEKLEERKWDIDLINCMKLLCNKNKTNEEKNLSHLKVDI